MRRGYLEVEEIPTQVIQIANHYSQATTVQVSILDVPNRILHGHVCYLCKQRSCLETHLHHAHLSERFGGSYVYFCNTPLLYWVSPVIINSQVDYALIAGPVMVLDSGEVEQNLYLEDERHLEPIPTLEIERVHHLAQVLRMCAGWASDYTEYQMIENRKTVEEQRKFGEYLEQLDQQHNGYLPKHYPIEQEIQLQEAIRWGNRKEAQSIMNELLGQIYFSTDNSIEKIHFRVLELISLLSRAAIQGGASDEEIMEITYRCQREIGNYNSIEGISTWLGKVLHQYTDLVFSSMDAEYGAIISQALRYIRRNFRTHITLEKTASAVSLSAPYLSRLFNERMNESFSTYVNRLRVEQAQRLLLYTKYPIVEVAGMVGFDDQSYFSKVFKSLSGISPGEYRRKSGRYPAETYEIHS